MQNKKNLRKRALMLVLAFILCLSSVAVAEEVVNEPAPAPVEKVEKVEEAAPEVKAEEPAEAAPEVKAEEPVEAAPEAEAEEESEPEVDTEVEEAAPEEQETEPESEAEFEEDAGDEIGDEIVSEDEEVEIDDYETPLGVTPETETETSFEADVRVHLKDEREIYFGDRVTLRAEIKANADYDLRWEVDRHDGDGWKVISGESGVDYDFTITEDNASYDYRVVLTAA